MLDWTLLEQVLIIASFNSTISVAFIQKIKKFFKCSSCIPVYSFVINIVLAILFSISFTSISFVNSLWVGLFSYIGADSIYKSLEGKLKSYNVLRGNDSSDNNDSNKDEELEEIQYE